MPVDGGIVAISGFLYQIYTVGGLIAETQILGRADDSTSLGALVRLTRAGIVENERFDQDLVLSPIARDCDQGIALVQMKYSGDGMESANISHEALRTDVIGPFLEATRAAVQEQKTVTSYWLVTNRNVPGTPQDGWTQPERDVYAKLTKIQDAQIASWRTKIDEFSKQYGLTDTEILEGRRLLFGTIFDQTQGVRRAYQLVSSDFLRCLAGGQRAKPLLRAKARPEMLREVRAFDADVTGQIARRDILRRALNEGANRALIVFEGPGGAGKTATLYDWAKTLAETENATLPMVAIRQAGRLPENWPGKLVKQWNPEMDCEGLNEAVERLHIANSPNSPPILHLGLDAIDDEFASAEVAENIKALVEEFAQIDRHCQAAGTQPTARLVVTCRSYSDFRVLRLYEALSGGEPDRSRAPLTYQFGFFSRDELQQAVEINCPQLASEIFGHVPILSAIEPTFVISSSGTNTMWTSGMETGALGEIQREPMAAIIALRRDFVQVLIDPVMWRAFVGLSPGDRLAWLRGNEAIDLQLGASYVDRFVRKAARRVQIGIGQMKMALRSLAQDVGAQARFRSVTDWVSGCCQNNRMSEDAALRFMREARSGGLIVDDTPDWWQWRNDIVARSLTAMEVPHGT